MDHVRVIEWEPRWDTGATCQVIIATDHDLLLLYNLAGDYDHVGLVTFQRARAHRLCGINDEVLNGHPLYDKGLEFYAAHEVDDSSWRDELRKAHSVHPRHNPAPWTSVKHYILCFHDNTLEVLAHGYSTEKRAGSIREVLDSLISKLSLD